jgi:formate dehydrogenase subunit beta
VGTIWKQKDLNGMLVPLNGSLETSPMPQLIDDPELLNQVNPFKPLMTVNAARLVPEHLNKHPNEHLGALMRPCEMRALVEMAKHDSFTIQQLTTICVDCLGTLSVEDYRWRAERKSPPDKLTSEALQFARQGGILAYRFRSACQMCKSPEARGADININVLGLPVRQQIMVQARDQATAESYRMDAITDRQAERSLVEQHERVLFKLTERHRHTMERLFETPNLQHKTPPTWRRWTLLPPGCDALAGFLRGLRHVRASLPQPPAAELDIRLHSGTTGAAVGVHPRSFQR